MKSQIVCLLSSFILLYGALSAGESWNVRWAEKKAFKNADTKKDSVRYLQNRLDENDKRFGSFLMALSLLKERKAQVIVETGTARYGIREFVGDGGSTIIFGDFAAQNGIEFHSVDHSPCHIATAKEATKENDGKISFTCSDSIEFLNQFSKEIDFLYLDSCEFEHNNPIPSQQHHLNELVAAYPCLHEKSIVMIDDCDLPHGGMGKEVIDYLTKEGWKIVYKGYQVILSKE